jgi:DNA end-binding protein Ku
MPGRAMWKGSIGFSLVNIPVSLSPAVREQDIHFHQLHDADEGRIREKRFCEKDGKEVPYEHIIKGYELDKHRTVTVTREELKALDPKGDKTIAIENFVKLEEVDPLYYERSYYVYPEKTGTKAYALLVTALEETGRVGIARVVLSTKQHLCLIRVHDGVLVLTTLAYDDEVAVAPRLDHPATSGKELEMAKALVAQLETPFEPKAYKDEHRERVLELLQQKAKGKPLQLAEEAEVELPGGSLAEVLERSLARSKEGKAEEPKHHDGKGKAPARRRARPRARASTSHH